MRRHVPNLLTFAGLLLGYAELGSVLNGSSSLAGGFLLLALLSDGVSGQWAKRRGHASDLGAELDSLACLIAFGVSVMVLAYERSLKQLGGLGLVLSVGVAVAVALRLSRDNASNPEAGGRYHGLPVPAFGTALGLLSELPVDPRVVALCAVGFSVLMLGPLTYPRLSPNNKTQYSLGLGVAVAALCPQVRPVVLAVALLYAIAAPVFDFWGFLEAQPAKPLKKRGARRS
jgi:CDP-diacylglycerol--serine O-phosphatidyltransferase